MGIAARDGAVAAGKGAHNGHVERVNASTILALIKRGLLVHCYASEGGLAGRLPDAQRSTENTDLAKVCVEYGMTLSDEERAGLRAYADNAPAQGSTLARLLAESDEADQ